MRSTGKYTRSTGGKGGRWLIHSRDKERERGGEKHAQESDHRGEKGCHEWMTIQG